SSGTATFFGLGIGGPTGAATVTFSASGLTSVSAAVDVQTTPGGPVAQLTTISPNVPTEVTVRAGTPVSPLPAVVALNAAGAPVPGVVVGFNATNSMVAGGGSGPSATVWVATDASGTARLTAWNLPTSITTATTAAALASGNGGSMQFLAHVIAAAPHS